MADDLVQVGQELAGELGELRGALGSPPPTR
jgi:hypothetical protein